MKYIIVKTEEEFNNINVFIHAFFLKEIAGNHSNMLIRDSDKNIVDITHLPDDKLVSDFFIYGNKKNKRIDTLLGATISYSSLLQRLDGKYIMKHPENKYPNKGWDTLLLGFAYTVEDYSSDWFPPIEQ